MQIYTLLSPCKSIPYYPHGMITPPFPVLPIFTTNNQISKKFHGKTESLNLKAPCNNVKMQLEKPYYTNLLF